MKEFLLIDSINQSVILPKLVRYLINHKTNVDVNYLFARLAGDISAGNSRHVR